MYWVTSVTQWDINTKMEETVRMWDQEKWNRNVSSYMMSYVY